MANWTSNQLVNSLLLGSKLSGASFTYYLAGYWTTQETAAFQNATSAWSAVADITFTATLSSQTADLYEYQYYEAEEGDLGFHTFVYGYTNSTISSHSTQLEGAYNYNGYGWDSFDSNGGLNVGGFGFATIVHELGHALGLDHPHADFSDDPHSFPGIGSDLFTDTGDNGLNEDVFTIMSYVSGITSRPIYGQAGGDNYGQVATPMAFDIAAIQYLYGANLTQNSGNTTYEIPTTNGLGSYFSSIWDTGGVDEIVYTGSDSVTIDLRSASLAQEDNGGGFISSASGIYGGYTIAGDFTNVLTDVNGEVGVIIENAIGGSGDDLLTGNGVRNSLVGGDGDDIIYGGNEVGAGDLLSGGFGSDTLHGQEGDDRIFGGDGNDILWGEDGNDYLVGNDGNDLLVGGTGNDNLQGRAGNDRLFGEDGDDELRGFEGEDYLVGNAGDDLIAGYSEDDSLHGRAGEDRMYGGLGDDYMKGGTENDYVVGNQGNDRLYGEDGHDNMHGRDGNDRLYGGGGNDYMKGGAGDDIIDGGDKFDSLFGEGGSDTFVFNGNWRFDTIKDWEDGLDVMDMSGSAANSFSDLTIAQQGANTFISITGDTYNGITLEGVTFSDINSDDFVFGAGV